MFSRNRALIRTIERLEAAHAEERRQLIDKICHLAGTPWTLPPREPTKTAVDPDEDRYIFDAAQFPDE